VKWRFVAVGKPSLGFAKEGLAEYLKRLGRYTKAEFVPVRSGTQAEEGERLLKASEGCYRIVFDERGDTISTADLTKRVDGLEMDGLVKEVAVIIGGAEGHGMAVREAADMVISFGRLTLQHELALVAVVEQVYRVYTVKRGEPYHR
jgi:23S rRNA (pseudouridine1915-N3)-methyltransferase